jgi:hypothetical protein
MVKHDWEDLGPTYLGAALIRGRQWKCRRCHIKLRSNDRPETMNGHIYVFGPTRSFNAGPDYPPDCDIVVIKQIMNA